MQQAPAVQQPASRHLRCGRPLRDLRGEFVARIEVGANLQCASGAGFPTVPERNLSAAGVSQFVNG